MALKIIITLVGAAALAFLVMIRPPAYTTPTHVQVGGVTIPVEVASSQEEQTRGLSGRDSLPEGSGLLFDFKGQGVWGIWMKDMNFPIDIVWANDTVVTVAYSISPDTYPQVFTPTSPVRYVLELPAGYAARNGIVEGVSFVVQ